MYYLFIMRWFVYIGNWFVYIGKNHCFTAFLDSNLHTRLAIVTANELGLAFPPRNLPKKFRRDPSTFYLVIVVTDKQTNKQTDRQTYAGDSIIPGIINLLHTFLTSVCSVNHTFALILLMLMFGFVFDDNADVYCCHARSIVLNIWLFIS